MQGGLQPGQHVGPHASSWRRRCPGRSGLLAHSLSLSRSPRSVSYAVIQIATQSGKSVYLTVTNDAGDNVVLMFKLISNRAASGLYRAVTETHAFYR